MHVRKCSASLAPRITATPAMQTPSTSGIVIAAATAADPISEINPFCAIRARPTVVTRRYRVATALSARAR
ncbi:MAG: hypothetical protein RL745_255, partial [Actinomycetota bacterium]